MRPQAKERRGAPAATRSRQRHTQRVVPRSLRKQPDVHLRSSEGMHSVLAGHPAAGRVFSRGFHPRNPRPCPVDVPFPTCAPLRSLPDRRPGLEVCLPPLPSPPSALSITAPSLGEPRGSLPHPLPPSISQSPLRDLPWPPCRAAPAAAPGRPLPTFPL